MADIFMMNEEIACGMVCFFHQKKHFYLISLSIRVFRGNSFFGDGADSQHTECKHAERHSAESQDVNASQCRM
jgi:hypothetical protein